MDLVLYSRISYLPAARRLKQKAHRAVITFKTNVIKLQLIIIIPAALLTCLIVIW